jgi:hypothetical protein
MAGSTSGVLMLIIILLSLMVVIISVVLYLKHRSRQKAFNLTSNVAYAGRCKNEDNDYYSISQPPPGTNVEMKDERLVTSDTTTNQSTEDQSPYYYDTINESQPTINHVPETNGEVLHTIIEPQTENGHSQPSDSPVLYDTIEETQTTKVLQSGTTGGSGSPATVQLSPNVAYGSHDLEAQQPCEGVSLIQNVAYEPQLSPNVAYGSHDLEALQPCEGGVNLVQNVAYKPTTVLLSPNVAYESHVHMHQGTEGRDEYEYI